MKKILVFIEKLEMSRKDFSKATIEWLGGWLSGGKDCAELPENVEKDIKIFMQRTEEKKLIDCDSLILYRGHVNDVIEDDKITFETLSSWSKEEGMARLFNPDRVIMTKVFRKDIFLDTTLLSKKFVENTCSGFPEEVEVIVYPGVYDVKVV